VAQLILTHTVQVAGETLSYAETITADTLIRATWAVANGTTDQAVTLSIDVSALKALLIYSNVNATLETNAVDATGGDTLTLVAGVPFPWSSTGPHANPFTSGLDVTVGYVTVPGAVNATNEFVALQDGTP